MSQVQTDSTVDTLWSALQILPDEMRERFIERLAADGPLSAAIAQQWEPAAAPHGPGRPRNAGGPGGSAPAETRSLTDQARSRDFSAPLDAVTRGRLRLVRGAAHRTIDAEAGLADLFRAHFKGAVPSVRVHGGTVDIRHRNHWLAEWAWHALRFWREQAAEIWLDAAIPWEIEIRGGVAGLTANLAAPRLRAFEIDADAGDVEVTLPWPIGTVPIRLFADASRVTLRRPDGVPVQVRLRNRAAKVTLDDQHYGAIGGNLRLATPDYDRAADRYDVEVAARAAEVTITSR